ncbi:hypothetical protein N9S49_01305 [Rhodobiaceae bacterium]|nr:hypothetical protein [Rhodobiaceae bacterium]
MTNNSMTNEKLFYLLQCVYFDNIDKAKANEAVEAMHDSIEWIHTQVWKHDGHDSSYVDNLNGREAVKFFLTERVKEMQVEGIIHKVNKVITDGVSGAFQASVIGTDGTEKSFFGWVETKDEKISSYRVIPS